MKIKIYIYIKCFSHETAILQGMIAVKVDDKLCVSTYGHHCSIF